MRTLSTTSKLLAFVAAALGVVASLNLAWFGASPAVREEEKRLPTIDGPVEEFFDGLRRAITATDGVSAHERFAGADTALLVLAGLAVVGAALAGARVAEHLGRWVMQMCALAIGVLVVVKLVQVSATSDALETRQGAVVALGCAGVMFITATHVAQQKLRRTPPRTMTSLHDPTLTRPGSFAPPGG